jgi:hypothetical protein
MVVAGPEMAGAVVGVVPSGGGARPFEAFGARALRLVHACVHSAPGKPRSTSVCSNARDNAQNDGDEGDQRWAEHVAGDS